MTKPPEGARRFALVSPFHRQQVCKLLAKRGVVIPADSSVTRMAGIIAKIRGVPFPRKPGAQSEMVRQFARGTVSGTAPQYEAKPYRLEKQMMEALERCGELRKHPSKGYA